MAFRALSVLLFLAPAIASAEEAGNRFDDVFGETAAPAAAGVEANPAPPLIAPPVPRPRPALPPLPTGIAATSASDVPADPALAIVTPLQERMMACCSSGTYRLGTFTVAKPGSGGAKATLGEEALVIYRALEATGLVTISQADPSTSPAGAGGARSTPEQNAPTPTAGADSKTVNIVPTELATSKGLVRESVLRVPFATFSSFKLTKEKAKDKERKRRHVVEFTFRATPHEFFLPFMKNLLALRKTAKESYDLSRHGRALLEFNAPQGKWRVVALDDASVGRDFTTATVPDTLRQR